MKTKTKDFFSWGLADGAIAYVTFDSGGVNTLSATVVDELGIVINAVHGANPKGVILQGNKRGLGGGANIGELMSASQMDLARLIDRGHDALFAIENSPIPWIALVDGDALGGIYELALACRAIVATKRSKVGLPEMGLNIFPGLGGTQRLPRRCGLVHMDDLARDGAFTMVLQGKVYDATRAHALGMIDAVIDDGVDPQAFAADFLHNKVPTLIRNLPSDLASAASFKSMVTPMIKKETSGREHPRAPFVALDVMIEGAGLSLPEGIQRERDAFLSVATSLEGKAGMRFFFTRQAAFKPPMAGKARQVEHLGVAGIDGYMGGGIAFLGLEAGLKVTGYVPEAALKAMGLTLEALQEKVRDGLRAKYAHQLNKGKISEADVETRVSSVIITTDISQLFACHLVIEALAERSDVKELFWRALGAGINPDAIVASNSSSMGPSMVVPWFVDGGGNAANYLNLHFFGPAELLPLVEIVEGEETSPNAMATAHAFVMRIKKWPVRLIDGSIGFLVNAGLAEYLAAAEQIFAEGTPIDVIDAAMREVFPMGPFEVVDNSGVDVAAGMFDTMRAAGEPTTSVLIAALRDRGRLGKKKGIGFYDYMDGRPQGPFGGLAALIPNRGDRVITASEIRERCLKALYTKACELVDRGIAASADECDFAFVAGIGFAMHLGGPIFYGESQGWKEQKAA